MNIMIISDDHGIAGFAKAYKDALKTYGTIDALIHAGDTERDGHKEQRLEFFNNGKIEEYADYDIHYNRVEVEGQHPILVAEECRLFEEGAERRTFEQPFQCV